ncbi:transposon protein, CACTA, En/Spm sub-class [Tanacetum coccineum]
MYQEYLAKFWYSAKALENSKVSFLIPTGGIYREVGLNTFRNAIGAHYLPHSSEYVAPPSIDVVRKWFPTIGYGEEVSTKGTLKKSLLPPRWSPKQPSNDIDVYLSPLIKDMKTLWKPGVEMYDAYMKEKFHLHAMIFCTINDFPAYDNLSGYHTKGKQAYPVCEDKTSSRTRLSRDTALSRVSNLNTVFGKGKGRHIEQGTLLGFVLNILEKTKDDINAQKDLVSWGIRLELAPIENEKNAPICHQRAIPCQNKEKLNFVNAYLISRFHLAIQRTLGAWFPFERYMGVGKGYVRNRSRPEGSIVEGYASEEVIDFYTNYLEGVKGIGVPQSRHVGRLHEVGTVGSKHFSPDHKLFKIAHFVVLEHMTCVAPYIHEHMEMLRAENIGRTDTWYTKRHNEQFDTWLKDKVEANMGQPIVDKIVERLGKGPRLLVKTNQGYEINGYTFYTKIRDEKSTVQNSRVTVINSTWITKKSYYEVIQEIWELDYYTFKIPLFMCKWVNNSSDVIVDEYGFTLVNLGTDGYTSEPFILAKQATQIFFVQEPSNPRCHVVMPSKRHILGVDNVVDEEEYNQFDELPPFLAGILPIDGDTTYLRSDHDKGLWVDTPSAKRRKK